MRRGDIREGGVADYDVVLIPSRNRALTEEPTVSKRAEVTDFDRSLGALRLVELALEALR